MVKMLGQLPTCSVYLHYEGRRLLGAEKAPGPGRLGETREDELHWLGAIFRYAVIPAKRVIISRTFYNQGINLGNSFIMFKIKF